MNKPRINVTVSGPQKSEVTPKNLKELTEDVAALNASIDRHGSEMPELTEENIGYQFFDTFLGKPIWWNGTDWVDALGNPTDTQYQTVE